MGRKGSLYGLRYIRIIILKKKKNNKKKKLVFEMEDYKMCLPSILISYVNSHEYKSNKCKLNMNK